MSSTSDSAGPTGKVLLVEDEAALADGVARGLKAEGFEVEIAYDGLTGLARAREDDIDVVVLDIMLPGMNGYKAVSYTHLDVYKRQHLKRILALGVAIAVALPFMDVVDPPDAGASLVFQDCLLVDDPIGGATLPEANDDINQVISEPGQVDVIRPLFETRWNRCV